MSGKRLDASWGAGDVSIAVLCCVCGRPGAAFGGVRWWRRRQEGVGWWRRWRVKCCPAERRGAGRRPGPQATPDGRAKVDRPAAGQLRRRDFDREAAVL